MLGGLKVGSSSLDAEITHRQVKGQLQSESAGAQTVDLNSFNVK